jgi:hypothetical protein
MYGPKKHRNQEVVAEREGDISEEYKYCDEFDIATTDTQSRCKNDQRYQSD